MEGDLKEDEEPDSSCCPLCAEFLDLGCRGCPVREKTGIGLCKESPYLDAADAFYESPKGPDSPQFKEAARRELEFLESLLPKEP